MRLRKSFVVRVFLILLAFFLILLTFSSLGVYSFSRRSVGEEFIRLNKTSLSYLAASVGTTLEELQDFGRRMATNSRILELSVRSDREAMQESRSILVEALSDFNATHMDGSALVEAYILTESGMNISAYNSGRFTWTLLQSDPTFASLLSGETDDLLLPTSANEGIFGIMGHTLQIAVTMRDLLTGESRGVVVLDISEVALYEQFCQFQSGSAVMRVVTEEGKILSAKNKRQIGHPSGYALEQLAQLTLDDHISGDYFLVYESIPQTPWLLLMQVPTEMALGTLTQLRNISLMAAAASSLVAVVLLLLSARKITARIDGIRDKMVDVVTGDLSARIDVQRDDEFGEIETAFNAMVEETSRLIEKVRQTEQQKHMAEMDFLHAQINSHFIHNTLTSIRFMLEMDRAKEAGEMIYYFSRLLRQTLSRAAEFIALRDELDTLKSYVMLQSYRYQNTFEASYDFAEETLEVQVPALILQPVVENAIFHGASQHFSHIAIRAFQEGRNLILVVEDDGSGIPQEKLEKIFKKDASLNRVGLRNVHERIQLIYGTEYGLNIDSVEGAGTTVRFTLPMDTEEGNTDEA